MSEVTDTTSGEAASSYHIDDYASTQQFMMAVMRDHRLNAEDTVYLMALGMELSNKRVAAFNEASEFYTSFISTFDSDGDGEVTQAEVDAYERDHGPVNWPSDFEDPNPPGWLGNGVPTAEQAENYASTLGSLSSAEADIGSLIMIDLQVSNNELDEADQLLSAYIDSLHQTNMVITSNMN